MLRLRKILLSDYTYLILVILFIPIELLRLNINYKSIYKEDTYQVIGIVTKYNKLDDRLIIYLKSKENLICYLDNPNYKISLGDKLNLLGKFSKIEEPTTKNLFNYRKYLSYKKIYNQVNIISIKTRTKSKNPYYIIKDLLIKSLANHPYLLTFIIGDKSNIKKEVLTSYQNNGISHLFAISGLHISLLSSLILKLLKKISENKRYLITTIFLLIYLILCNPSASILRAVLFFIFFSINKIYYFYIKPLNIFIVVLIITLLINPYYIYDIGFLYSFTISFSLLLLSNKLNSSNYFISLFKISIISFLVSLPISLYNFSSINILGIVYNLIYVPLISLIIFPLSLMVFIFRPLLPFYNLLLSILEKSSCFFANIKIGTFIFPRASIYIYFIYYLILYLILKNKKIVILFLSLLLIHYLLPNFINNEYINILDVGQGDSILIRSNNTTCLLDTGGIRNRKRHLSEEITIPYLKTLGIRKINKMILSHGDYDHLGEATTIISNIKVDSIYLNSNKLNYYEKELYKYSSNINILREGDYLECGNLKLYQLNTNLNDENDSSLVLFGIYNKYTFLFMGDASKKTEEYLLNNYDLPRIDILKVGHHGSKTSSSIKFINEIKPIYSIISVGRNNKFNHPNIETINNLSNSKIYRTDRDGSITIMINKKIEIKAKFDR